MTPRQVLAIIIKLSSVWLLASSIISAASLISVVDVSVNNSTVLLTGSSLVTILLCAFLWHFHFRIADWFLRGDGERVYSPSPPNEWFVLGCNLMGLCLGANAIPRVVTYGMFFLITPGSLELRKVGYTEEITQLLTGLFLLFGVRCFKRRWLVV